MKKYGRFWAALATLLVAVGMAVIDPSNGISVNDGISGTEAYILAGLTAGAALVAIAPDVPGHRYVKPAALAIAAVQSVLTVAAVSDGLSTTEVIMAVTALLGVFAVGKTKNEGDYGDRAAPALRPA
jgi:hypothetical protein